MAGLGTIEVRITDLESFKKWMKATVGLRKAADALMGTVEVTKYYDGPIDVAVGAKELRRLKMAITRFDKTVEKGLTGK